MEVNLCFGSCRELTVECKASEMWLGFDFLFLLCPSRVSPAVFSFSWSHVHTTRVDRVQQLRHKPLVGRQLRFACAGAVFLHSMEMQDGR